jgi:hypothetical protein
MFRAISGSATAGEEPWWLYASIVLLDYTTGIFQNRRGDQGEVD